MRDCLFCRIVEGDVPAEIVYRDDSIIAFRDIHPAAPVHVLVVPRQHITGYADATEDDELLLGRLARIAARVAAEQNVADTGYRLVVNSGQDAQQSVPHLHIHVLGARQMGWPPG